MLGRGEARKDVTLGIIFLINEDVLVEQYFVHLYNYTQCWSGKDGDSDNY